MSSAAPDEEHVRGMAELHLQVSVVPSARRTYDGSSDADVHALPLDSATFCRQNNIDQSGLKCADRHDAP
jgi:hypothetical protein